MRVTQIEEARMRGEDHQQAAMWSSLSPEQRVPADHPLRAIRAMVDAVLGELSPDFETLYAPGGRPSIPPEKLLRAQLLQVLYTVRSERLLMEQLDYSLLFRWFVGLNLDEPCGMRRSSPRTGIGCWTATWPGASSSECWPRRVRRAAVGRALHRGWHADRRLGQSEELPREGHARGPPEDPGNPTVNFHGEKRSNETQPRRPIRRLACSARGSSGRRSCATRGMC